MILITKGTCPIELSVYARSTGASYGGIPPEVKAVTRTALLKEQGFLCAYCMNQISEEGCKIEHIVSQSRNPAMSLSYSNMLACCLGGQNKDGKPLHCDSAKRGKTLTCTPLANVCISSISYKFDGTICSNNTAWNTEINEVLRLNISELKKRRKLALTTILDTLTSGQQEVNKYYIDKVWNPDEEGRLHPYCGFVRYFLNETNVAEVDAVRY